MILAWEAGIYETGPVRRGPKTRSSNLCRRTVIRSGILEVPSTAPSLVGRRAGSFTCDPSFHSGPAENSELEDTRTLFDVISVLLKS